MDSATSRHAIGSYVANARRRTGSLTAHNAELVTAAMVPNRRGCREVQQDRRDQHEEERQNPGSGQAPDAVGKCPQCWVNLRGARIMECGNRVAMQPVRPLQVPLPQVVRLVAKRGVAPHEAERESGLNREDHDARGRGRSGARRLRDPPRRPEAATSLSAPLTGEEPCPIVGPRLSLGADR